MTHKYTGGAVIGEFIRRKIAPDAIHAVAQGTLEIWLVGHSYAARITKGPWSILGTDLYINTCSPQEIADDIQPRKDIDMAFLTNEGTGKG